MAPACAPGHAVHGERGWACVVPRRRTGTVPGDGARRVRLAERCRIRRGELTMAHLYRGYVPSNVARDAKSSIRNDLDGEMNVHLVYRAGRRERALLSTDLDLDLVRMVNDVKIDVQGV